MFYHFVIMFKLKFSKLFVFIIFLPLLFLLCTTLYNKGSKFATASVVHSRNITKKYIAGTFYEAGGFGNQIWRFASLYGIGKVINRQPYIEKHVFQWSFTNVTWKRMNLTEMKLVFPLMCDTLNILSPQDALLKRVNFAADCCQYDEPKKLLHVDEKYLKISGDYLQSYKYFHPYKNDVKKLLECGHFVMRNIHHIAYSMYKDDHNFKLCVYIRRGDFIKDIMLESREEFVIPAIKYVQHSLHKNGNNNISLVILGNDEIFARNLQQKITGFKNIYISQSNTRGEDMCFGINHCDAMLLTASGSTFGWWMAYLMKSNGPVFYNSQVTKNQTHSKDIHHNDIFLPEWTALTIKNGVAIRKL